MFGHRQRTLRQVEHLAAGIVQHWLPAQTAPAALWTGFQPVNLNVIGIFDPLQGLARMTGLAAGFATAGSRKLLGLGLFRPSLEGGLPLLELLRASWASNSCTRCSSCTKRSCKARIISTNTSGWRRARGNSSSRVNSFMDTRPFENRLAGDRPKHPSPALAERAGDPAGCVPGSDPRQSSWPPDNNCPGTGPVPQTSPTGPPDGHSAPASPPRCAGPPGPKCGWPVHAPAPKAKSKTGCCWPPDAVEPGAGPPSSQ